MGSRSAGERHGRRRSAGRRGGGGGGEGGAMSGYYVLCSVTLGFPFSEGVARAFSVIVACGRCVCVSALTAKIAVRCVEVRRCVSLSWDWTRTNEMEHKMSPGDKLTTQLPETLRHMPELQVKIKITKNNPSTTITFT